MTKNRDEIYAALQEANEKDQVACSRVLCEAMLALEPEHIPTLVIYARALREFAQFDHATEVLTLAERVTPPYGLSLVTEAKAKLLETQRNESAAAVAFERAYRYDPDNEATYLLLDAAQSASRCGDVKGALRLLDEVIRLDGDFVRLAKVQTARLLLGCERYEEAGQLCREILTTHPDHRGAASLLAEVEQILSSKPPYDPAEMKAWLEAGRAAKRWGVCVFAGRRYLESRRGTWVILVNHADALTEFHRYDEAEAMLARAEELKPKPSALLKILCRLGHLSRKRGDPHRALQQYLRGHELQPGDDATPLIYAGVAACGSGDVIVAETFARQAAACPEGCIDEALHNLGGYLLAQRRYAEARQCYLDSLKIDPDYDAAKERLADLDLLAELTDCA